MLFLTIMTLVLLDTAISQASEGTVARLREEIGGYFKVETDYQKMDILQTVDQSMICLLYTSPSPRDATLSRMPSSA